jgi:Fusaric acid resistance protein-like
MRRFGTLWSRVGTLIALPFIAILIAPGAGGSGSAGHQTLWTLVVAATVVVIVNLVQLAAQGLGFVSEQTQAFTSKDRSRAGRRTPDRGGEARMPLLSDPRRWAASSRMALQMAVGLGTAFVIGKLLWPEHWSWVVLTAYIVASGNRGRGDVIHKSGLRVFGAAAGAVIATLVSGLFSPGDNWALVLIFCILAIAVWLRQLSYVYWAAGVTAMLSILYGYLGVQGDHLIFERVAGIIVGAVIAVACAWYIAPVRTSDVLRRRVADTLAALSDWIAAARRHDLDGLGAQRRRLGEAVALLEQISPSLKAHRRLVLHPLTRAVVPKRGGRRHDLIDGLIACREAADAITDAAAARPQVLQAAGLHETLVSWQRTVGAARRSLRSSSPPPATVDAAPPNGSACAELQDSSKSESSSPASST